MGELFPSRFRSILGPLSSSFNLMCTFTVVRSFPNMQTTMTKYGVFWFFMCCTMASLIFVFFFLPETKGKTLEEIEKLFTSKLNADGSASANENVEANQSPIYYKADKDGVDLIKKAFDISDNKGNFQNGDGKGNKSLGASSLNPIDSEDEEEDDGATVPTPL